MQSLVTVLVVLLSCITLHLLYSVLRIFRERIMVNRTKGRLPPAPTGALLSIRVVLLRMLCWYVVGKIDVRGKENLDDMPAGTPFIFTPNHSHVADGFIAPLLLEKWNARFMAAPTLMNSFGGLFGLLFGFFGAFVASRKAGVEVLTSGQTLLMFPEGWAYLDGKMGPFKLGVLRIAKDVAARTSKPVYLVPVFMRFGKYPGSWIRKLAILPQLVLMGALCPLYRSGVRVVIGKPIAIDNFSRDEESVAIERLRQAITSLDPS